MSITIDYQWYGTYSGEMSPLRLKIITVFFCAVSVHSSKSQNLVPNGGFEDFKDCPSKMSNLNMDSQYWSAPTLGTTDYFNTCSNSKMGVPLNFKGEQLPQEGEAYAGLYLYAPNDYREYMQVKLRQTLIKGEKYRLQFQISLSEDSNYAIKDMEMLFTEKPLSIDTKRALSRTRLFKVADNPFHMVELKTEEFCSDKKKWMQVSTEFEAYGNEGFLVFGNFKNNRTTKRKKINNSGKETATYAYYYLDNIQLGNIVEFEPGTPYVLDQVLFKFDTYSLLPKAKADLYKVYGHLMDNPDLQLTILGHTDDLGSDAYNQFLSQKRAKAVAQYLIGLGLSAERIAWKGHGNKLPIDTSFTDEGRKANRRVEFVMTQFIED
ncbi:MAG: OmpA family protein [Bacteroidota bacterium]